MTDRALPDACPTVGGPGGAPAAWGGDPARRPGVSAAVEQTIRLPVGHARPPATPELGTVGLTMMVINEGYTGII